MSSAGAISIFYRFFSLVNKQVGVVKRVKKKGYRKSVIVSTFDVFLPVFLSRLFSRLSSHSSRSRAYFFSLAWLHSCPAINSRESGWPRPSAYLCLLSPFLSRTWGSRVRVEKMTTRTASLLHASYSQREAAVPLGSTPRPGPTGKNRFLRRALPFLLASSLFAPHESASTPL